jgi:Mg2+ and Co2+ transporter CorA
MIILLLGGQPFLDGQFNSVNSSMILPANPLTDKYAELIARFKSNIRHLYEELFLMEQVALKAIQDGEMNFEERIRAFSEKINTIQSQINEWADILKFELEVYALTLVGDLENILDQYKQNIDSIVQSIEKMFQQLTQNLMKNFLDFTQNVIPDAAKTIENLKEQGLLSFLSK